MKRLILMRHAKSSWAVTGQPDIERPLNKRGIRNSTAVGEWLKSRGYLPDLALVSIATRTRETWARLAEIIGPARVEFVPALYDAEPEAMLTVLRGAADVPNLLVLGHQPGIGALAHRLLASPPDDAEFGRYPTAATAVMDFDIQAWGAAGWEAGVLADFAVPRALE
jgi:phosphohistidine phosphatase